MMERYIVIVNVFQQLTIITKRSILDVAAVLDPPLVRSYLYWSSSETTLNLEYVLACSFGSIFSLIKIAIR